MNKYKLCLRLLKYKNEEGTIPAAVDLQRAKMKKEIYLLQLDTTEDKNEEGIIPAEDAAEDEMKKKRFFWMPVKHLAMMMTRTRR